jgi:hypothetical protein
MTPCQTVGSGSRTVPCGLCEFWRPEAAVPAERARNDPFLKRLRARNRLPGRCMKFPLRSSGLAPTVYCVRIAVQK